MPPDVTFNPPELWQAKTVLAIQPHYDDNDLGAGGTLAALSRAGARLIYLTVTDDQVGVLDASLSFEDTQAALRGEQAEAAQHIGVAEQRWLGYPDAGPIDYHSLRENLIVAIRELRPDLIFTVDPWLPYEFHRDHVQTGLAASEAAGLYAFRRLKIHGQVDKSFIPHRLLAMVYYFTHMPNTFFDIGNTLPSKQQAVRCYRSQFDRPEMEKLLAQLETDARRYATGKGYDFAESLKVLRPDQLHIQPEAWQH